MLTAGQQILPQFSLPTSSSLLPPFKHLLTFPPLWSISLSLSQHQASSSDGTPHHDPGYVRWLTNISVNANFNCVQRDWPCPCPCYMFCVFRQERGNLWCETSKEFAWACNTIKKTLLERRSTSDILLRSFLSSLLYLSRLSSIQKTSTLKKWIVVNFWQIPRM